MEINQRKALAGAAALATMGAIVVAIAHRPPSSASLHAASTATETTPTQLPNPPGVSDLLTAPVEPGESTVAAVELPESWSFVAGSVAPKSACFDTSAVVRGTKLEVTVHSNCDTAQRFVATFRYTCANSSTDCTDH